MLRFVHRYLGLSLCLLLLVISITGVLLLWKKEYLWLTINPARDQIDRTLIEQAFEEIVATYPVDTVQLIRFYSDGLALHKAYLTEGRRAWHAQSGHQLQVWKGSQRIEEWLLDLHHRFLLGNTIGLNMAGFSGILFLPLAILGFCIWWPRRRNLKLGLLPRSRQRGMLIRSHGNIGAVAIIPLLLLTVTGVILVYPAESRSVLQMESTVIETVELDSEASLTMKNLLSVASVRFPDAVVRWAQPQASDSRKLALGLQSAGSWDPMGRTTLSMNEQGQLSIRDETAKPMKDRVFDFSYPAHTGQLGFWYRLFLSLIGVGLALLSGLGLYSFMLRNQRPIAAR